jgi:hypothetical protein
MAIQTGMGAFGDPKNAKRPLNQEPPKHSGLSLRSDRIALFLVDFMAFVKIVQAYL